MRSLLLGFLICWSVAVGAAPTAEKLRVVTLKHVQAGTTKEGIDQFTAHLSKRLNIVARVPTRELQQMVVMTDCIQFMQLTQKAKPTDAVAEWILTSGTRLHQFVDLITPQDQLKRCFEIMDQLRAHDPEGSDEYYNLILAISVVLDYPKKVRIHGQMGRKTLLGDNDPIKRYDYFKALYSSNNARISYKKLGATELCFVVHTPVPVSELEWACKNVRGSLSSWGTKVYSGIVYDHARLNASRYSWDTGEYTLSEIKRRGGICVDQAYYSVITARAHGIPSIYFHGSGKTANHAWFSFMKAPGDWVLDVGRYQGDSFTTGFAIDPQTRQQMTDHDVEYACERSLHSSNFAQASAYNALAEVLLNSDPKNALRCAKMARQKVKRFLRPWEIELQLLIKQKKYSALIELFADKKDAFRKYPDILTKTAKTIEPVLRKGGRDEDADRMLRSLNASVDSDRDDLKRSFESDKIDQIIKSGDFKKARKKMEKLLEDQQDEGNKIFPIIREYVKFTKKSEQTHEAVKFLKGYIEDLIEDNNFSPGYEKSLLTLLKTAYENDGDRRNAAIIRKQIERINP